MIGTTFGIVLVLIAAFILEELLIPKEDKLFIAEFESELKDQFCRLSEWHPTVTKGYLPNSEMEVRFEAKTTIQPGDFDPSNGNVDGIVYWAPPEDFDVLNDVCRKHKPTASPSVWDEYCGPGMIEMEVDMFLNDKLTQTSIEPRFVRTDVGESCDDNNPKAPKCPDGQICDKTTSTCVPKYSAAKSTIKVARGSWHEVPKYSAAKSTIEVAREQHSVGEPCDDNDSSVPKCPVGQICSQLTYTCVPKYNGEMKYEYAPQPDSY